MDNPHTQEVVRLAYTAGLIDGEGTVTLERTGNRRLSGVTGLQPKILIANTDEAIVQYAVQSFQRLGVNPHIKSQDKNYARRRKTCYWVTVAGLAKVKKILAPLVPYLVGKQAQARLLLDFIEHRGDPKLAKGKPYGEYEIGILDRIRALNHRGVSETEDYGLSRRPRRESNDSPVLSETVGAN